MNNLKFLRSLDLLGASPFFLIKKQKTLHTSLGGGLTLLVSILIICIMIFFSQEFFIHVNPTVNQAEEPYNSPGKIYYDYKNFHFIIGVQNKDNQMFIDPSVYYVEANYKTTIINSTGTYSIPVMLNITYCNNTKIDESISKLYEDIDLNLFYCLSDIQPVDKEEIYVNDYYGHDKFRMLQVKFYRCRTGQCKSESEIESSLLNSNIDSYIISHKVHTRDYDNPIQLSKNSYFFPASKTTKTSITHYLHHMEVQSDTNIMFTSKKIDSSFVDDKVFEQVHSGESSTSFASYTFQLNNIIEKYYRKYYKLQDFAAQVGGILSFVNLVTMLIMYMYNEITIYEHLINYYFDIIPSENDKESFKQVKRIYFSENKKNLNTSSKEEEKSTTDIKESANSKKRYWSYFTIINFNLLDRLFFITCLPRNKCSRNQRAYKYFKKGKEKIQDKLNFCNYFQMSFDINLLQTFLVTEEQNNLMHVICKPILTGDRKNYVRIDKKSDYAKVSRRQAEDIVNFNIERKEDLEFNKKLNHFIKGTKHLYTFQIYD